MAGVGGEAAECAERCLQSRDHRVERRHQVGEITAFLAQRQAAVQAATIGDRRNFSGDLRELPLRVAEEDERRGARRDQNHRHDDQRVEDVLARNPGGPCGERARRDPANPARSARHRMGDEQQLLLEGVELENERLTRPRQIAELVLEGEHVGRIERHQRW